MISLRIMHSLNKPLDEFIYRSVNTSVLNYVSDPVSYSASASVKSSGWGSVTNLVWYPVIESVQRSVENVVDIFTYAYFK